MTQILSIVIGEGASGGALGIGLCDKMIMLEHTWFSVISPEGCASILWKDSTKAPDAAGVIHSDFKKKFIRAETVSHEDFIKYKGFNECKNAGKLRLEGKDYLVNDGDVMLFRTGA